MFRKVEQIFDVARPHWVGNGFRVYQYLPQGSGRDLMERFSPFLVLDYNAPFEFKGTENMVGVAAHPHRGFETVSFAFEGRIEHHDNAGSHGVIDEGDIQWMTAGDGILHKEYHEREYARQNRIFHMVQLWVNLPRAHKRTPPAYQSIRADEMGLYETPDGRVRVHVCAGEFQGVRGPARTFSPIHIYRMDLAEGGEIEWEEPERFNLGLLVIEGELMLGADTAIRHKDFVLFENTAGSIRLRSDAKRSRVLVLCGEPLNEPIAAGGPFVMSTREELNQAFLDFERGAFGTLDF